jgi:hypothetical protein
LPTTVEEACETKPLANVARPVWVSVPSWAVCEKRLVVLAVVENKVVEVAFVKSELAKVERPVALNVGTWRPLYKVEVAEATKLPTF